MTLRDAGTAASAAMYALLGLGYALAPPAHIGRPQAAVLVLIERLAPVWPAGFLTACLLLVMAFIAKRGRRFAHGTAAVIAAMYGTAIIAGSVIVTPFRAPLVGIIVAYVVFVHFMLVKSYTHYPDRPKARAGK